MMEQGVNSPWAVEILEAGAPGGRTAVMMIAKHWPSQFQNEADRIGESFFSSENNVVIMNAAFDAAYDDAGEEGAKIRRDIQRVQTWLWNRAGLTIFPKY